MAVAAANDYVSGGVVVMRTSDGGQHWASTRITPQFRGTRDFCNGGDPAVAYSRRDGAFYLSQLCFFRALPYSEVQVYKSVDNGATWTPGRQAARAASNFDYSTGTVDESIFNDKEYITVDNNPTSPHYGRLYVTYTKFHIQPNGFSDYCPIQLAYTDSIPTQNPALTTCRTRRSSRTTPAATARAPRRTSSPTRWSSGTGRSTSGSSPRSATTRSTRICCSSSRPTEDRRSCRMPCRSTRPASTRTSTTAPVRTRSRRRTSARRTLRHWPTARATGKLLFVYQNNVNRPASAADISYQTSTDGGLHWSDAQLPLD